MKKKALSLVLSLVMCLGLTVPAFAAEENYFTQHGLTVSPEPPTGVTYFTFANYEYDVPREDAIYILEDGQFYVESCTAVPADQAGYQTITLKLRAEMFLSTVEAEKYGTDLSLTGCGWDDTIYDYYTGRELNAANKWDDDTASSVEHVTYGGKTYTLNCSCTDEWVQGEWDWDNMCDFTCYQTITVTAPVDYDGLVLALRNKTSALTAEIVPNAHADGKNVVTYFRFGPKAVSQPTDPKPDSEPTTPPAIEVENIPASGTAYASTQTVTVDGKAVEFQMYALKDANGNGTNYIKLRDMAYILNGTKAQFSVGYDNTTKSISVTSGQAYQAGGTEMTTPYSGDRSYTGGTQSILVNGKATDMTAITLLDDAGGGYNYFKLRDLGKALGFNVGWSKEAGVFIESDKPYTE